MVMGGFVEECCIEVKPNVLVCRLTEHKCEVVYRSPCECYDTTPPTCVEQIIVHGPVSGFHLFYQRCFPLLSRGTGAVFAVDYVAKCCSKKLLLNVLPSLPTFRVLQ